MTAARALLALLGLLALLSPVRAAEPYDIGGILSLTGGGAFLGTEERDTLRAVERLANAQGGINGTPLRFVIEDDTSSPTVAVQLATDMLARHVPLMLGPTLVASCNAVMPLFKNGPIQYCFAPGIYPPAGAFTFAAGVSTRDLVVVGLRYFRAKGWSRIGLIASTDATGQEGERMVNDGLALPKNKDMMVVRRAYFNTADVSADAQMALIRAADPQIIIAWTTGTPFATVLRSYGNVGMSVPLFTNSGNIVRTQMERYAAFAPKELYFGATRYLAYKPSAQPDAIEEAQRLFFDTLGKAGINPDTGPSIAWDTAWIIIGALRKLGPGATGDALHDYIEQLHDFTGINGVFDFRTGNQRGLTLSSALVVKWDGARKFWFPVSAPGGEPLK